MAHIVENIFSTGFHSLPEWFRQDIPDMEKVRSMQAMFRSSGLHTVCESARCPNIGKCWGGVGCDVHDPR